MSVNNAPLTSDAPAQSLVSISPSDSTVLEPEIRGFMVNVAGDVVVVDNNNTEVTLTVLAGVQYSMVLKKIKLTNTTATGITGFR